MSDITPKCSQKRPVFGFLQPIKGGIPNAVQQGTMVNDLHEFLISESSYDNPALPRLTCRFCAQTAEALEWRTLFEEEERLAEVRAKISVVNRPLGGNGPFPA